MPVKNSQGKSLWGTFKWTDQAGSAWIHLPILASQKMRQADNHVMLMRRSRRFTAPAMKYPCQKMDPEIVMDFGKVMYTLPYLKCVTSKDLLCSTGNAAQCYMAPWMGEEFGNR